MNRAQTPIRWLLGLLLIFAAIAKLADPVKFLASLYAYDLGFPDLILKWLAVGLPWMELMCGALLLADRMQLVSRGWVAALFLIFLAATGRAWAHGLDISCGCLNLEALGVTDDHWLKVLETPAGAFVKNLPLTVAATWLFYAQWRHEKAKASDLVKKNSTLELAN
jgi:putative oxidoreductase